MSKYSSTNFDEFFNTVSNLHDHILDLIVANSNLSPKVENEILALVRLNEDHLLGQISKSQIDDLLLTSGRSSAILAAT